MLTPIFLESVAWTTLLLMILIITWVVLVAVNCFTFGHFCPNISHSDFSCSHFNYYSSYESILALFLDKWSNCVFLHKFLLLNQNTNEGYNNKNQQTVTSNNELMIL
jgi:hypothetical protein